MEWCVVDYVDEIVEIEFVVNVVKVVFVKGGGIEIVMVVVLVVVVRDVWSSIVFQFDEFGWDVNFQKCMESKW